MRPVDTDKMYDSVLRLMETDIRRIKKIQGTSKFKQLPPNTARTLILYVNALRTIRAEKEADKQKEKQRLDKLTNAELLKLKESK